MRHPELLAGRNFLSMTEPYTPFLDVRHLLCQEVHVLPDLSQSALELLLTLLLGVASLLAIVQPSRERNKRTVGWGTQNILKFIWSWISI